MTAQTPELFWYDDTYYRLIGYTDGDLPTARDYGMHFKGHATNNYRGHIMVYGIDDAQMLVTKHILSAGKARKHDTQPTTPTTSESNLYLVSYKYKLDAFIPFTGFVLFSRILKLHLMMANNTPSKPIYEVGVIEGHVTHVIDISKEVYGRADATKQELGEGRKAHATKFDNYKAYYDYLLPRPYDVLYYSMDYHDYKNNTPRRKHK